MGVGAAVGASEGGASSVARWWGGRPVVGALTNRSQDGILASAARLAREYCGAVGGDAIAVLVGSQSGAGRMLILRTVK